jgi:hypothetical protein
VTIAKAQRDAPSGCDAEHTPAGPERCPLDLGVLVHSTEQDALRAGLRVEAARLPGRRRGHDAPPLMAATTQASSKNETFFTTLPQHEG